MSQSYAIIVLLYNMLLCANISTTKSMYILKYRFLVENIHTQYAERVLNEIKNTLSKTFAGKENMFQRFRIYFALNHRLKDIESTS